MANREKKFYDWEYIQHAAELFQGMDRIHLTGGEPSMHPRFINFVPLLKDLFKCNRLTIETNGFAMDRYPFTFGWFDEIYFSHYREGMFEGCEENMYKLETYQRYTDMATDQGRKKPVVHIGEINHINRDLRPGTKMCARGTSETVAYVDGKIYPCCIGSGLDTKIFLDNPGADWREKILEVYPPCHECFFALP